MRTKMLGFVVETGYYELSDKKKDKICNGAGAAGDWKSKFIPNTLYGLDCSEVFNIHDYAYYAGKSEGDKERADVSMLINLVRLIDTTGGILSALRRYRAVSYYNAVHWKGDPAFFTEEKLRGGTS